MRVFFLCTGRGVSEKEVRPSHECGKKGYVKMEIDLGDQFSSMDNEHGCKKHTRRSIVLAVTH